jgi:hypothetical protein
MPKGLSSIRRQSLKPSTANFDPFQDPVVGHAVDDVVSDVGDHGSRRQLRLPEQLVPESALQDARQAPPEDAASGSVRAAVAGGREHLERTALPPFRQRHHRVKAAGQVAGPEEDEALGHREWRAASRSR